MASNTGSISQRRNPFARVGSPSASPAPGSPGRPKSAFFAQSPLATTASPPVAHTPPSHNRTQSHSSLGVVLAPTTGNGSRHHRESSKSGTPNSTTFAPSFIKTEDMRRSIDVVKGIEGENDFSGKRYVWLKDPQTAFVKGWVVEELGGGRILVQCDDGSVKTPIHPMI